MSSDYRPSYISHWNSHAQSNTPVRAVTGLGDSYDGVIRNVLTKIAPKTVRTVYDLGCGAGLTYPIIQSLWPKAHYTGLDVSSVMIEHCAHEYPQAEWWLLDEPDLPVGKADLIICHSVFTHIYPEDAIAYLKLMHNRLGKNGRASISIHTDCKAGWQGDVRRIDYEQSHFEQMLARCGLGVLKQIPGNQLVYGVTKV